jgi:N-acylneuraminate cytidylyltransferase
MNVVAFIPVRGEVRYLGGKPLLQYTVEQARASKYIKKVIVSTDNEDTAALAKSVGAETPFLRDRSFSRPDVDLAKVLRHSLEKTELAGIFPDIVVCMEITFPFRPKDLIDNMIAQLAENGFDSVVAARLENKTIWQERDGRIGMITDGIVPRELKEPVFIELKGVGCVTHPEFLRGGRLMGSKIGIYELKNPYSHLEVRDEEDIKMASMLADSWFLRE